MLRLLLLSLVLAVPASAQIRVAYEVAPIAILGNVADYGGGGNEGAGGNESAGGEHRSISATIPMQALGDGLALRVAYLTFTDEVSGETTSFPGAYLNATFASDGSVGGVMMFEVGYDLYNKEALSVLGLIPTFGAGLGPRISLGPMAIEATVGAQVTSILQGVALTGRIGVSFGG